MDRLRIYQGRTLVGVEFAPTPSSLSSLCKDAHVFERLRSGPGMTAVEDHCSIGPHQPGR
ncbi:MAG TPA: hypothetical protein VI010_16980 [Xanthobacteraceae bacterium]|jgi:hypothetical protein